MSTVYITLVIVGMVRACDLIILINVSGPLSVCHATQLFFGILHTDPGENTLDLGPFKDSAVHRLRILGTLGSYGCPHANSDTLAPVGIESNNMRVLVANSYSLLLFDVRRDEIH